MSQKGHLGPRPRNEKGWWLWLGGPEPPGLQTKIEAWGLGIWKLARKANDGRIWPEAINDDWGHERPREGAMSKGDQLAIKDMVCPIGPNLVPG
ncbi:hypothetical protein O181_028957 [Austropuccinia psidii MF-1]|uniref:Uncharacterized protein n=1 Tax=Austropuccinia psidii MF-1 TaxID=1389203 RepID=A0A9Q3CVL4_9BASI|nr:hypothetical protein [Austropuccinia psidii MF-1]